MSLLPAYVIEEITEQETKNSIPIEYEIDWETGRLTGNMVSGLDAIKIWIQTVLQTQRYRYLIYTWDYGNEIEELIGHSYSEEYLEAEAKRMIEECLLVHNQINKITDFTICQEKNKLIINFIVDTPYGFINIENKVII